MAPAEPQGTWNKSQWNESLCREMSFRRGHKGHNLCICKAGNTGLNISCGIKKMKSIERTITRNGCSVFGSWPPHFCGLPRSAQALALSSAAFTVKGVLMYQLSLPVVQHYIGIYNTSF
ncbi:MAG TPA: hypothetical protein VK076_06180 [Candidatus Sphingobacterium stercoripullorum]|nr:hypothetical protein [Candidatus Sphingobacterium stercoripullorum]